MVGMAEPLLSSLYVYGSGGGWREKACMYPASLLAPSLPYGLYSCHLLTEAFVEHGENCNLSSTRTHSVFRAWRVDSGFQEGSRDF